MATDIDLHIPYADDGLVYCGWDHIQGCGHLWPCPTVLARRSALPREYGERAATNGGRG